MSGALKFLFGRFITKRNLSKVLWVYKDSDVSFSTVKNWAGGFKLGRTSFENGPRKERSKVVPIDENYTI